MLPSFVAGIGLGLSLIVAIGAQNLFVLRQGIRREHAVAVAAVCALSDAVLIAVGVSGLGAVLHAVPWLIETVRWAGAVFLAVYAVLAARRALRPGHDALRVDARSAPSPGAGGARKLDDRAAASSPGRSQTTTSARARLAPVLLTCLALTWLNPHVYLDTVFLLGSVAATHADGRWWFGAGAALASFAWFFSLALGARHLGRVLATPRAWRVLDGIIAVVMLVLAISLVWPR